MLGRGLIGAGHTRGLLDGLTAILRYRAGWSHDAVEQSAMLGMLRGATPLDVVPHALCHGGLSATR